MRALDDLAARGLESIVVGIPNSGAERLREYSPVPGRAPRRRRRRRLSGVHRADAEAADRSPRPHPAGTRGHRHLRIVDGRADQPVLVLPRARDVRVRRRHEPVALVRRPRDPRLHREGRPAPRPPVRGRRHRRRGATLATSPGVGEVLDAKATCRASQCWCAQWRAAATKPTGPNASCRRWSSCLRGCPRQRRAALNQARLVARAAWSDRPTFRLRQGYGGPP